MHPHVPIRPRRNRDKGVYRALFTIAALLLIIFTAVFVFGGLEKMSTAHLLVSFGLLISMTFVLGMLLYKTKEESNPEAMAELDHVEQLADEQ